MFKLALLAAAIVASLAATAAPAARQNTIHVFIVVPAGSYSSTVTPDQAVAAVQAWIGQPTDPACLGSTSCQTEAWLKAISGKTFAYTIQVAYVTQTIQQLAGSTPDQCGSYGIGFTYTRVLDAVRAATGYSSQSQRTVQIVLGAGGTASHIYLPKTTSNGSQKAGGVATLGDWGIEEQAGTPNPCIPTWDYPMRGWAHEFMGALGAYCTPTGNSGCFDTDDNVYNGDPLTSQEQANLSRWSGQWLNG